jgi:hypothetical protein
VPRKAPDAESFAHVAELLLHGARGYEHNSFKIELVKQGVVRALTLASQEGARMMHGTAPKPVKQLNHCYEGIAKVTGNRCLALWAADHPPSTVSSSEPTSTLPERKGHVCNFASPAIF